MGARFVDRGALGWAAVAKLVAKPGGKLESAGAAADDNDAMRMGFVIRRGAASHCIGHRSLLPPCFDQRTRQGFLLPKIQPGIRYCVAIPSPGQKGVNMMDIRISG